MSAGRLAPLVRRPCAQGAVDPNAAVTDPSRRGDGGGRCATGGAAGTALDDTTAELLVADAVVKSAVIEVVAGAGRGLLVVVPVGVPVGVGLAGSVASGASAGAGIVPGVSPGGGPRW